MQVKKLAFANLYFIIAYANLNFKMQTAKKPSNTGVDFYEDIQLTEHN